MDIQFLQPDAHHAIQNYLSLLSFYYHECVQWSIVTRQSLFSPMEMFSLSQWWILVQFIWNTGNPVLRLRRAEGQNTEHNWGCSRKAFQCQGGGSVWRVPWEVLFERLYKLYATKITFLALCL